MNLKQANLKSYQTNARHKRHTKCTPKSTHGYWNNKKEPKSRVFRTDTVNL